MKYAILSDIHSNYEALRTVLELCYDFEIPNYIFLGDIVGYNADPEECVGLCRYVEPVGAVTGNHDLYTTSENPDDFEGVGKSTMDIIKWTRICLSEDNLDWLASLPQKQVLKGCGITIVHSTLDSPENWGYITDEYHAELNFRYQFTPLCFIGHSHIPALFSMKPVTAAGGGKRVEQVFEWNAVDGVASVPKTSESDITYSEITFDVQPGWKYLINPGGVGQPRNGDSRASFAVYDDEEKTLKRVMVEYNIAKAQEKINHFGLGERTARRLERGR